MSQAFNREQSATLSDSSNESGNLSLSCSVSSIESEESEVSEVEGDLETVMHANSYQSLLRSLRLQLSSSPSVI